MLLVRIDKFFFVVAVDVFGVLWIKGVSFLKLFSSSLLNFHELVEINAAEILLCAMQFFPKNETYVSLFSGGDDLEVAEQRSKLRKQIKANIIVAAASGKELEGTDDMWKCLFGSLFP